MSEKTKSKKVLSILKSVRPSSLMPEVRPKDPAGDGSVVN